MTPSWTRSSVGGWTASGYEALRDAFVAGQAQDDGSAQLAVYRHGRQVAALHSGAHTDSTLAVIMSCTKGVMALLVQRLAEAGRLDVDAPIASLWPAFADGDKAHITLRHVLTHSAGLMGFEAGSGITAWQYADWPRCTGALAGMAPLWAPGAAYAYHFATWGFLVGEVVRRATADPLGRTLQSEITGPLDAAFWIGLPEAQNSRVVPNTPVRDPVQFDTMRESLRSRGVDVDSRLGAAVVEMMAVNARAVAFLNTPGGRAAVVPALNGVADASALARIFAGAIGGVDDVRLLSAAAVDRLRARQTEALGPPPGIAALSSGPAQRLGLGVELSNAATPMLGDGSFGHAGIGGQIVFAHPESGFAAAYLCGAMTWGGDAPDPRWLPWTEVLTDLARR